MRLFVTHMPGFTPDTWPVVSFSDPGSVRSLKSRLDDSGKEARVLFVGSGSAKNADQRGRLLGLVDVFDQPIVPTRQVISGEHLEEPNFSSHFNVSGNFRWPCGLVIRRAWTFDQRPDARSNIGKQNSDGRWLFRTFEISAAYELDDVDQIKVIMGLPRTKVKVHPHETIKAVSKFTKNNSDIYNLSPTKSTTGPAPGLRSHERDKVEKPEPPTIAYCYVFRFDNTDCWKVGWSTDTNKRTRDMNWHIPTEVIGNRLWSLFERQQFSGENCQTRAYEMEQLILASLSTHRTAAERVCCSENEILDAMKAAKANISIQ